MALGKNIYSLVLGVLVLGMSMTAAAVAAEAAAPAPAARIFAKVNDRIITLQEFETLYAATIRQRFYHGKVEAGQPEIIRKEVTDIVVERALLLDEADKRGLKPDAAKIEQELAGYEARYAASPRWKEQREKLLPGLKEQLGRQNLLEQVEPLLRAVPVLAGDEVRAYYDQHAELFTEPEKLRLSVILLKVDPSAPTPEWDKAREEAQAIYQQIHKGADFAELARTRSGDDSAAKGGDLGYVHRGMLPEAIHDQIDKAQLGVVGAPITTLEGVALFRLDERVVPKLREFKDVEVRAGELLMRERQAQARKESLERLRAAARIEIATPPVENGQNPQ